MKTYAYDDQSGHTVMTEDQIIESYYQYWSDRVSDLGRHSLINRENCIEDWVCLHWAYEVTDGS